MEDTNLHDPEMAGMGNFERVRRLREKAKLEF
jgi:hypothetical protein